MPCSAAPASLPDQDSREGRELSLRFSHVSVPGITFLALCLCIALGATRSLDWWGQSLLARLSFSLLDLTGSLLTFLGEAPITGAIAMVLAVRGWRHRRGRGLGPLLLFAGVGLELLLKYILTHPAPPAGFDRHLPGAKLLHLSASLALPISFPSSFSPAQLYSFPSGHMLRSTFLMAVASDRKPQWRRAGWLVVVAMAVTRVYCNEHWMSDVVGGVLLGWTLAAVATAWEHEQRQDAGEVEGNATRLRQ